MPLQRSGRDASTALSMTNAEVIEIKPDKMPVGKHDKDQESFTLKIVDVQEGDIVYALTDGFPDQFGGEKGKKYMGAKFKNHLQKISSKSEDEQLKLLSEEFSLWIRDYEQIDDVCVMGVKII